MSGKSHCAVVLANLGIDLNEKDTHTMSLPIITPLRYIFLLLLLLLFLVVGFPCISFDMCAEECSREIASRCRFGGHCNGSKRTHNDRTGGRASEREKKSRARVNLFSARLFFSYFNATTTRLLVPVCHSIISFAFSRSYDPCKSPSVCVCVCVCEHIQP